ncbi:MAG: SDR family oxidoreductase [Pseudomonadota bacterium]
MPLLAKIIVVSLFFLPAMSASADDTEKKAILVTGASTGIGLRITEVLAKNGYVVYAGARKEADLKRLDAMENVESVRLDVTVQEEIDAAVKFVEEKGRGLHGLVNNAGILVLGPMTEVPVEELEWQFDVNVYGPYRVTQAFAPLIIENKGRITTTGSISGILSGTMFGQYSMSKHAIEAFTDSLSSEMARFDVQVSVVEPGNFKSKIGQTFYERLKEKGYWAEGSPYADEWDSMTKRMGAESQAKDPKEVADAVLHAMSSDKPKLRYMVTPNEGQAHFTVGRAMQEMLELNHDHAYSLSRDQLVEMLDSQLEKLAQ